MSSNIESVIVLFLGIGYNDITLVPSEQPLTLYDYSEPLTLFLNSAACAVSIVSYTGIT
jgi:hypothetical protein